MRNIKRRAEWIRCRYRPAGQSSAEYEIYRYSSHFRASPPRRQVGVIQGGPKKWVHRLMTIILSNLNRFKEFFFTGRFVGKFVLKWILKILSRLAYVATLPCETLMPAKQALKTNYKVV